VDGRTEKVGKTARSKGQCEGVGDDDWLTEPRCVCGTELPAFPRAALQGQRTSPSMRLSQALRLSSRRLEAVGVVRGRRRRGHFDKPARFPLAYSDRPRRPCPQGMGGYGLQSGVAWRMLLPPDLIGQGSLNCLEFLAALVGVWVEHQVGGPWTEDEVLLCQGDSSSASGWITRSSFGDECPLHLAIARTMAKYMSDHRLQHYSQWFPGKENSIADALLRDFWLDDEDVVDLLKQNFAHQLPQGFRLVRLSEAIVTDVGSLLRLLPKTQLLPLRPAPSGTAAGGGTSASSVRSGTSTTPSSLGSGPMSGPKFSRVSLRPSVKDGPESQTKGNHTGRRKVPDDLMNLALDGRRAQFVPPSTAWRRPIGLTNLAALHTTSEDDSNPFWPRS
jgi:hypothetical protein